MSVSPPTARVPVTCTACGSSIGITLTLLEGLDGPALRADTADIALTVLFSRAHRGPLLLAGLPA